MSETLNTPAAQEVAGVEKVVKATGKASAKKETLKVKFLLSPCGKFKLGYNIGEVASFPALQAEELIEAGYAELVK